MEPAKTLPYMPTKAKEEDQNTPEEVLEPVRRVFGGDIDLDPCGNPGSIVRARRQVWLPKWAYAEPCRCAAGICECPRLPPDVVVGDGICDVPWEGDIFVNPPYSAKLLSMFMARSRRAALENDAHVIMLCKSKTGLKGWQANVRDAPAVCFIGHRLTFGGAEDCAPFDCALILWTRSRELVHRFALELDGKLGDVMFHR